MLKQFFILCSGADKNLLEGCSEGEQTKYVGIGANALGGPELAFTWLANHLIGRDHHLRAGDVVTTGVITGIFDTMPGDEVLADYTLLGAVSVKL